MKSWIQHVKDFSKKHKMEDEESEHVDFQPPINKNNTLKTFT